MNLERFWSLIEEARKCAASSYEIASELTQILAQQPDRDLLLWQQIFSEYQKLSYKGKLWAAAYVMNGGCSDDGFDYFRGWLTAQGKAVFLNALADPDSLVDVEVEIDEAEDEDMLAAGYSAYFIKQGMRDYDKANAFFAENLLDESLKAAMLADIHYAEDIDCDWDEDDLESVVPRLCAKFY